MQNRGTYIGYIGEGTMKVLKYTLASCCIFLFSINSTHAELSSGGWTKVEAVYSYFPGGAYCGPDFGDMVLVQLSENSSIFSAPCEKDYVLIDNQTSAGKTALSIILSAKALNSDVKINVENSDQAVCAQDGKVYCKAVQVNSR
ncbi:hypothetical protein [Gilvimarinus algae]|uniref:Uncharacterized protein n=1 Tax=Gilvimarinus algae TaxID=3058037 RepID=A0ABT8TE43_9GAMM|nr:hypothetical protein [Gilvimarinus sp. SDUM040014]MDO3382379.1 hypothetical protein [Gilvimarinus sp. SDUM040014]